MFCVCGYLICFRYFHISFLYYCIFYFLFHVLSHSLRLTVRKPASKWAHHKVFSQCKLVSETEMVPLMTCTVRH